MVSGFSLIGGVRFSPSLTSWTQSHRITSYNVCYTKLLRVYIGIAFIAFLFLIITRSRGPFVSCFIASAVYWSLATPKRHQSLLIFFGIIIVGCLIYFLLGYQVSVGFSEIAVMLGRTGESQSLGSLTGRVPLWKAVIKLVMQRPFIGYVV